MTSTRLSLALFEMSRKQKSLSSAEKVLRYCLQTCACSPHLFKEVKNERVSFVITHRVIHSISYTGEAMGHQEESRNTPLYHQRSKCCTVEHRPAKYSVI